jgi:hypothetical protein
VTQQHDTPCLVARVGGREGPPEQRRSPEDIEQGSRNAQPGNLFRLTVARERRARHLCGGDGLKHILLVAPIGKGRVGRRAHAAAPDAGLLYEHQLFGFGIGQRPQGDVIHHTEHRRGRADSEREHQNRRQRKSGGFEKAAQGKPKVRKHDGLDGRFEPRIGRYDVWSKEEARC